MLNRIRKRKKAVARSGTGTISSVENRILVRNSRRADGPINDATDTKAATGVTIGRDVEVEAVVAMAPITEPITRSWYHLWILGICPSNNKQYVSRHTDDRNRQKRVSAATSACSSCDKIRASSATQANCRAAATSTCFVVCRHYITHPKLLELTEKWRSEI